MCYTESEEHLQGLRGVLVSPYIGVKVLLNTFSGQFGYAPTKVRIFKAQIVNYHLMKVEVEEIQSKGSSSNRLIDYGLNADSKIFIAESNTLEISFIRKTLDYIAKVMKAEGGCIMKKKKNEGGAVYGASSDDFQTTSTAHGEHLGQYIKEDYMIFQGSQGESTSRRYGRRNAAVDFFDEVPSQFQGNNQDNLDGIPPEYRDDPELYFAIQASLNLDPSHGGNNNIGGGGNRSGGVDDLNGWAHNNSEQEPQPPGKDSRQGGGGGAAKTPSTGGGGDNYSCKNNDSVDSVFRVDVDLDDLEAGGGADDDDATFPNYNQSPSLLARNIKRAHGLQSNVPEIHVSKLAGVHDQRVVNEGKVGGGGPRTLSKQERMKEVREQTKQKYE